MKGGKDRRRRKTQTRETRENERERKLTVKVAAENCDLDSSLQGSLGGYHTGHFWQRRG